MRLFSQSLRSATADAVDAVVRSEWSEAEWVWDETRWRSVLICYNELSRRIKHCCSSIVFSSRWSLRSIRLNVSKDLIDWIVTGRDRQSLEDRNIAAAVGGETDVEQASCSPGRSGYLVPSTARSLGRSSDGYTWYWLWSMRVTRIRQPFGNERLTGRKSPGCSDDRILAVADDQAVKVDNGL